MAFVLFFLEPPLWKWLNLWYIYCVLSYCCIFSHANRKTACFGHAQRLLVAISGIAITGLTSWQVSPAWVASSSLVVGLVEPCAGTFALHSMSESYNSQGRVSGSIPVSHHSSRPRGNSRLIKCLRVLQERALLTISCIVTAYLFRLPWFWHASAHVK